MSLKLFLSILFILLCVSYHSQTDSLKQIFSAKSFTLIEAYTGDWGGHTHTIKFNVQGNKIRIQCENRNNFKTDTLLSKSALSSLENIFITCSKSITTSKNKSTEHIVYKFKSKDFTYIIDDKFTMECNGEFKAWKETYLPKQK